MKKFKKMLVALCLCVCVALSAGLVGCADSKTLAEIDDLKAKIEQKDTTIAEKDAKIAEKDSEIEDKNAQISGLTLTDLQKIGIMGPMFEYAQQYATYSSDKANAFLKTADGERYETDGTVQTVISGVISSISLFLNPNMETVCDVNKLVGGVVEITGLNISTDENITTNVRYLIEYNKDKYVYHYETESIDASVTPNKLLSKTEIKQEITLNNGRVESLTIEQKEQVLTSDNHVKVNYLTNVFTFTHTNGYMVYPDIAKTNIKYTASGFDVKYNNIDDGGLPADLEVAVYSGHIHESENRLIIDTVEMIYGSKFEENAEVSGTFGSGSWSEIISKAKTDKNSAVGELVKASGKEVAGLKGKQIIQKIDSSAFGSGETDKSGQ